MKKKKNPSKQYKDAVIVRGYKKTGKLELFFYVVLSVAGGYVGYLAASFFQAGHSSLGDLASQWSRIMSHPFSLQYWNGTFSAIGIAFGLLIMVMTCLAMADNRHNYMPHQAHGSARWASPAEINTTIDNNYNAEDKEADKHFTEVDIPRKFLWFHWYKTLRINTYNIRLSKNLYLSLDTRFTDLNNNILVVGGSGAGKTFRFVKPNIMSGLSYSFILTDPKGELERDTSGFFAYFDYTVKVIDLRNSYGLLKSTRYNPFEYLKTDLDVIKLISNLISNTTPKGATPSDPFWEKAEGMALQGIFHYVWKEGVFCEKTGKKEHNLWAVMWLVNAIVIKEDQNGDVVPTKVHDLFSQLEQKNPNHSAVIFWNNSMSGAADTVRSIVISFKSRLSPLNDDALLDFMWEDEIRIEDIGQERTALFCKIPDNDKTYNFIIGMLYTQCFQILYDIADNLYDGALPIHVRFMFDEFANVALPDAFMQILSTERSRNMSSTIIIQNMAQIKGIFKDDWESITGNTDTFIFLGGNESSTHKYVSEFLGKATIDKYSTSRNFGSNGSSSKSDDEMGRELLTADEIGKLRRDKCIVKINGKDPVMDYKVLPITEPLWRIMTQTAKTYVFDGRLERHKRDANKKAGILTENETRLLHIRDRQAKEKYDYEKQLAAVIHEGEEEYQTTKYNKTIIELTPEEVISLASLENDIAMQKLDEISSVAFRENMDRVKGEEQKYQSSYIEKAEEAARERIDIAEFSTSSEAEIYSGLRNLGYENEKIKMLLKLAKPPVSYTLDDILKLFHADMESGEIEQICNILMQTKSAERQGAG